MRYIRLPLAISALHRSALIYYRVFPWTIPEPVWEREFQLGPKVLVCSQQGQVSTQQVRLFISGCTMLVRCHPLLANDF